MEASGCAHTTLTDGWVLLLSHSSFVSTQIEGIPTVLSAPGSDTSLQPDSQPSC